VLQACTDAILTTERLELRPSELRDLPAVHALWTDADVRRFLFDDREIASSEAEDFLKASVRNFAEHGYGIWLVFEKARPDLAGFAGLLRGENGAANLVYGIHPELTGRGYATEAARAVLRHAFANIGLTRIAADVDEPNVASIRVLEKLGMERVGRAEANGKALLYFVLGR